MTDPTLRTIDGDLPDDLPVFGRNPDPVDDRKVRSFGLEVETQHPATRGNPPHIERTVETFRTYVDLDAGAVFGIMSARGQHAQANATAVLLGTTLDDLDGVPVDWRPPAQPEYDDDGNIERTGDGDPLYLDWRGDLVAADALRIDELAQGSSRRRFSYLMDSTHHRVRVEALTEVGRWLMAEVTERPTVRPTPSGRGQQQTGRSSRARSR